MSRPWPTVTCTACGATGPGRAGQCRRCYARARHTPRVCAGCSRFRRHLAAGLCARCYRLSRTRQQRCAACDEVRPVYFGDRCERCKQRARARTGPCATCGQHATLTGQYCRACLEHAAERVGSCTDCLCWTGLLGGRCKPCRLFGFKHDLGTCPSCDRRVPLGAAGRCRLCLAASRATGTTPSPQAGVQLFGLVGTPATAGPPQVEPPAGPTPGAGIGQLRLPLERPHRPIQPSRRGRATVGSCADCLCWTVLSAGRCRPCRRFRRDHPAGSCPWCGRRVSLGTAGRCRLCLAASRATGTLPSGTSGIQLFLLLGAPTAVRPAASPPRQRRPTPRTGGGQLRLSRAAARAAKAKAAGARLDPKQQALLAALADYGQARGWSPHTMQNVRRGLLALLSSCGILDLDAPVDGAAVRQFLIERRRTARRVVEFLADQGVVTVNDQAVLDGWLARRLEPLPAQLRAEVHAWVEALRGRGPRAGRPRKATTIQGYLRALEPTLGAWSARYQSLRQVTGEDVTDQLEPLTGPTRLLVLAAMRSLFRVLKAQRVIFANPTAGLVGRQATPAPVLGLDPGRRAGLLGQLHRPGERLVVLLTGVHALRCAQLCALTVDAVDLAGGTLLVDGQPRRLDALTLAELRAWLAWRRARWPRTANPYLLVNQSTAGGLTPVKRSWVQAVFQRLGTTAHDLRVDRFLAEVHTTGGDPLKLAKLFGLSDTTAIRYCLELGPLGQASEPVPSP
jgi:hypothetical protein